MSMLIIIIAIASTNVIPGILLVIFQKSIGQFLTKLDKIPIISSLNFLKINNQKFVKYLGICLIVWGMIFGLIVGVILQANQSKDRLNWKNTVIQEISRWDNDKKWISEQISKLKTKDTQTDGWWVADRLILMKDGEWLIYKSHCAKKAPHNIADIFIAKGSDGKWYYSTYHFCVDMFVLKYMNEFGQSKNLKEFLSRYYLKTFDIKSDECLLKTWSPEIIKKKINR